MRAYLTTAYNQRVALRFLQHAARMDRHRVHEIDDDPRTADVIVFVENGEKNDPFYETLLSHPLVSSYPDRVYMYNEYDLPYCALPGLYASMPKRTFDAANQAACSYLFRPNDYVSRIVTTETKPDLLFSFVGAPNHRMRRRVLRLSSPRAHVEDTSAYSIWAKPEPESDTKRRKHYAEVMARSKFVLCPRGAGTSSFRLFETMEAGRVPVVLSDQWVEPRGPDWSFVIRIPQAQVATTPRILEAREAEACERGRAARLAWEQWFAPDVMFHHTMDSVDRLRATRRWPSAWSRWIPDAEYLRIRITMTLTEKARCGRDLMRRMRTSRENPT